MAKVKSNDIMVGLSGKLGKQLSIRHMKDGRTFVLTRPDFSNRVFSEEQLTHQSRFQQAAAYARMASKANPLYTELARDTAKNAYNLALSDWFQAPVIHEVSRQAGRIRVNATDNMQVVKVLITILNEKGETLEQAEAARVNEDWWEFETQVPTAGKVIVEAFDLAGNCTRYEA